jgi:hypothetical protein
LFNNNILKQPASAAVYLNKSLLGLKSAPPIPKNHMQQKELSRGGIKMTATCSGTRIKS